ncbi:metallophosphatase family protein [Guyparkeria hydrothermalis]|uniref:metallophosphoesterase family protein n=1 Tax=Guyparkeria hydrothermalis TaxID=923 RepID=UPI0020210D18|nr:metallophosphoesterase family protein [Guyparkeria hydrothermalis]MCL7744995.1 metallophosphatase family protein [Guyparkeria hydrothermalis]
MDLSDRQRITLALISDTHGTLEHDLLPLLAECDVVVHAGDLVDPVELRQLAPRSGHVIVVRGNNDTPGQWPQDTETLLDSLPEQAEIALPGGLLVIEHGHRVNPARTRHQRLRRRHPEARAIVYGHTHRRVIDTDESPWVLNPGAAGRQRAYGGPGFLRLIATADHWEIESITLPKRGRDTYTSAHKKPQGRP